MLTNDKCLNSEETQMKLTPFKPVVGQVEDSTHGVNAPHFMDHSPIINNHQRQELDLEGMQFP